MYDQVQTVVGRFTDAAGAQRKARINAGDISVGPQDLDLVFLTGVNALRPQEVCFLGIYCAGVFSAHRRMPLSRQLLCTNWGIFCLQSVRMETLGSLSSGSPGPA